LDTRFALLLACFFLSGFAALLYQTAWTRELSFVFGTSELAVAAVLAAYMGGLALGAAAAARIAHRLRRPVLAYGVLELAIAVSALSVPLGIRLINSLYVGLLGGGSALPEDGAMAATLFQVGAAFAVLLPPTAFMGATLPLLARHAVRSDAEIGSRVGMLYAVNTAGAIAGTVCAAFWLMPELGLRHTVWVGAAFNGLVFVLAAWLARHQSNLARPAAPVAETATFAAAATWILPAIALSGAVSFAYEVLWTRLLGQLLGASLAAFASMLASFLLGIALGSAFAARVARSRERAAVGFGVAQLGIAFASCGAFLLADRLPELAHRLGAGPGAPLAGAGVAAAALLPITLCIGTTFPFAVRLLACSPEQAAAATARVYAWNTVGAIVGALSAGFLMLPRLGFAGTVIAGVAANLALATVAALAIQPRRKVVAAVAVAAAVVLFVAPPQPPWTLLRTSPLTGHTDRSEILYTGVGRSCSVVLFDHGSNFRLTSNGLPESRIDRSGIFPQATLARWLGLLPTVLRPEARAVLVIGLGGGVAIESIASTVESIDVIELEREILTANQIVAGMRAIDPLARRAVRVHVGDARGSLQLSHKRYDAIVSQPSHPWTAGASHLYTREFFRMVRSRLERDGVFVQWIGLRFVDEALLRSLAATLTDVFEHVEIYQPGAANGLLFAASAAPLDSIANARKALRANPGDVGRFGVHRVEDFAVMRVLDDAGVRALALDAELNTDDHNLLASRAARVGDAALDGARVHSLWRNHDPLIEDIDGLDRSALIRKLVAAQSHERATDLAASAGGALEESGLGWVELGLGRPARAARHFARALELAPDSRDARVGLVASRPLDFVQGRPVAGVSETDLDERTSALIAGWRYAAADDLDDLAALDPELRGIGPGEPLFEDASRLRIRWRLAGDDPDGAAEALSIVETLLSRKWTANDALLRARAAIAALRPAAAWGSLIRVAELRPSARRDDLVASVLEIAEELPNEAARDVRERLQAGGTASRAAPH